MVMDEIEMTVLRPSRFSLDDLRRRTIKVRFRKGHQEARGFLLSNHGNDVDIERATWFSYALDAIEPTAIHATPSLFNPGAKIASGLPSVIANFCAQRPVHLIGRPIGVLDANHRLAQVGALSIAGQGEFAAATFDEAL